MIEAILIYFLAKLIGRKAEEKGHRKGPFILLFVALWIVGEAIGAIIGIHLTQSNEYGEGLSLVFYLYALIGAAIGTIISFLIVYNLKEGGIEKKKDALTEADEKLIAYNKTHESSGVLAHTVVDEKLIVYNKAHESYGILAELEIGSKFIIDLTSDFPRFYKVRLADGKNGYILKPSKYSKK